MPLGLQSGDSSECPRSDRARFLSCLKACLPERSAAESKDRRLFLPLPFLTRPPIGCAQVWVLTPGIPRTQPVLSNFRVVHHSGLNATNSSEYGRVSCHRGLEMLPWWKRLAYSFVSVLFASGTVGVAGSCRDALVYPGSHLDPAGVLWPTFAVVVASLSGWLVAIPIVLLVRDYSGWRAWLWAAIGIGIGPTVIFGFAVYGFVSDPRSAGFAAGASGFFLLSTLISILSTCGYLFLTHYRSTPTAH